MTHALFAGTGIASNQDARKQNQNPPGWKRRYGNEELFHGNSPVADSLHCHWQPKINGLGATYCLRKSIPCRHSVRLSRLTAVRQAKRILRIGRSPISRDPETARNSDLLQDRFQDLDKEATNRLSGFSALDRQAANRSKRNALHTPRNKAAKKHCLPRASEMIIGRGGYYGRHD